MVLGQEKLSIFTLKTFFFAHLKAVLIFFRITIPSLIVFPGQAEISYYSLYSLVAHNFSV